MIISDKSFLSNCFFQAIKHKLLDWKNIKFKILLYWDRGMPHLHFYWQDNEYDYHFLSKKGYVKWKCKPIFLGEIHQHGKGMIKRSYKKLMKNKNMVMRKHNHI